MTTPPPTRLDRGDWLGIAASVLLLVSFFVPWYGISIGAMAFTVNGFRSWGWLTFAALVAVVTLLLRDLRPGGTLPRLPSSVGRGTVLLAGGAVEAAGALLFLLTATRGAALGLSIGPRAGAFVALVAAAGTMGGGVVKGWGRSAPPAGPPPREPETGPGVGPGRPG